VCVCVCVSVCVCVRLCVWARFLCAMVGDIQKNGNNDETVKFFLFSVFVFCEFQFFCCDNAATQTPCLDEAISAPLVQLHAHGSTLLKASMRCESLYSPSGSLCMRASALDASSACKQC
jgi:hypothetical protein